MRRTPPSMATALLATLYALLAGCGPVGGGGETACAAHAAEVEAKPARAAPGGEFRLRGEGFADYSGRGGFLRSECPRPLPERGVRVEFEQGMRIWTLPSIDAEEDLSFEAYLEVPEDAGPGKAVVRATGRGEGLEEAPPPAETPFLVLDAPSRTDTDTGATQSEAERCIPIELFDASGPVTRIDPDVVCEQDPGAALGRHPRKDRLPSRNRGWHTRSVSAPSR